MNAIAMYFLYFFRFRSCDTEEDDPALQTELVEPAVPQDGPQRVDSADGVEWDLCEDLEDEQAVRAEIPLMVRSHMAPNCVSIIMVTYSIGVDFIQLSHFFCQKIFFRCGIAVYLCLLVAVRMCFSMTFFFLVYALLSRYCFR